MRPGFGKHQAVILSTVDTIRRTIAHLLGPSKQNGKITYRAKAVFVGSNRLLVGTTIAGQRYAFYLEADDRLLTPWFALTGSYELEITNFLLRSLKRDHNCIDVGANFGYFSCLMGRRCTDGQVLGIEPDPEVAALAQDNLFINGLHSHTSVLPAAASDQPGTLTLHRREYRSGNTSITAVGKDYTDYLNEPPAAPFDVEATTIDACAEKMDGKVDIIKVDVEGAEPLVLAGARETIRRNPSMVVLMEWSPLQIAGAGFKPSDLITLIRQLGLKISVLDGYREKPIEPQDLLRSSYQSAIILRKK